MNVLILGSGGREHTLAWKLAQSLKIKDLFIAPGNAGTEQIGTNIELSLSDFNAIKDFAVSNQIKLVVVGPEQALVDGIYDFFARDAALKEIILIGPSKKGAQLEGSKEFAKEFMQRHQIPTASYQSFTEANLTDAYTFLETLKPPYVLKADGLAAGKGVLILNDLQEAKEELKQMLSHHKFGKAGSKVVIEEYLDGIEMSCFVLTDAKDYVILPNAKDYKRIGEGDTGLNTGGMGAISPVPFADKLLLDEIERSIIKPSVKGLQKDAIDYIGFLFIGLMIVDKKPFVIEYNVRLGDPETEVIIPRLESDLLEIFLATKQGNLADISLQINPKVAATVMAVSGGYPEAYEKEKKITGTDKIQDSLVFHAGTKMINDILVTSGGRVLAITSFGENIQNALQKSYMSMQKIDFKNKYYRSDIGFDL
jgi:phosphoribosylamine--glycine ligase